MGDNKEMFSECILILLHHYEKFKPKVKSGPTYIFLLLILLPGFPAIIINRLAMHV